MPRVVPRGGFSGLVRRRYTARHKLALLTRVGRLQAAEGITLNNAALRLGVSASLLSKWKAVMGNAGVPLSHSMRKKSAHDGPIGQFAHIEDALLVFIFELREQGMAVSNLMIVVKASMLCGEFAGKTYIAKFSAVRRFVKAHSLVYRMGTHESQRPPDEVADEAAEYMTIVRKLVVGPHRHLRWIMNMDQTPVFFSMGPKKTLARKGEKTVNMRTSTSDTKRATVAVTICADGTVLPSALVFKGQPNGRIVTKEFPTYPPNHQYHCQAAAWMDEKVMIAWVDGPLAAHVANAPDDIIPLLILDSYRCHMMASVVQRIQDMGVEVIHIPGGCTSLCQPVDVGFNKPFKDRVRRLWTEWMVSEGVVDGATKAPSRLLVAGWVNTVMAMMSAETTIMKNAWMKTGYEWFYG